jgi:hypothetical protein
MMSRHMRGAAIWAVLFVAACSSAAPTDNPTSLTPAPGSTPAVTAEPGATDEPGGPNANPGIDIEWDYGPGTYEFPAPASGLSNLDSYRSTLVISFAGTEAGQPSQWSNTYEMIAFAAGAERQLTLAAAGDQGEGAATPIYRAELNGVAYERDADAACTTASIHEPDSLALRWEPASFLSGVTGAVETGVEDVNGLAATRYTFDQRAFGPLPASESTGEMWIASDGGYLVRYLLTTIGTAEYFGEGNEGTLTFDYQLNDVNAAPAIDLPADCVADAVDAPLLPDAADVARVPGLLSYTTASTPEEVTAFYQEELTALGWEPTVDPTVSETTTIQNFTRDGEQLAVLVTVDEAGSSVLLSVSPIFEG